MRTLQGKPLEQDKDGITFDMGLLRAMNMGNSYEQSIKNNPLLNNRKRVNIFRSLIEKPATRVNWNNKEVVEARKEMEKVMQYNEALLQKGYHPQTDEAKFKKLDPNMMLRVFRLFGFR
jgi:hypothetical protein